MSGASVATQKSARIKGLDVVRGFALLGILAVNAGYFAAPYQSVINPTLPPIAIAPETAWAWMVMHVFFELKMVTLFSLLFGASIYLVGGETHDAERGAVLRRRLAWLLIFGMLHGALIWYGDILFTYALTGLVVMFARSWPARRLLTNAMIIYGVAVVLVYGVAAAASVLPVDREALEGAAWAPSAAFIERTVAWFAGADAFNANFQTWWTFTASPFSVVFMARTAALMMIGMALYKLRFFSGAMSARVYGALIALGAVSLALIALQAQRNIEADFASWHMSTVGQGANNVLSIFVSLGYASVLILLVKAGALRFATEALSAVGRMAFTNYITQSLIMTTIFYGGRGLGLFGQADREMLWLIVLCVWALQLVWSQLWLARFEMGPLEWAWRRLSYARAVTLTR